MNDKKSKILTYILVGIILAIICVLAYFAYNAFAEKRTKDNYTSKADEAEQKIISRGTKGGSKNTTLNKLETSSSTGDLEMEGYRIIGIIEIPKVDLKCPILDQVTSKSIEIAVAQMYTVAGLNQPGNTVIYGHNYRNSLFFSRNDELEENDLIYIRDAESGERKEYKIFKKFQTMMTDTTFYTRSSKETDGLAEVTLSTCTDDAATTDRRLIIQAREVMKEIEE